METPDAGNRDIRKSYGMSEGGPCCTDRANDTVIPISVVAYAMRTDSGRPTRTRRHDDRCVRVTLGDFIVDVVPIERAVTGEGHDRTRHLVEQSTDLRANQGMPAGSGPRARADQEAKSERRQAYVNSPRGSQRR